METILIIQLLLTAIIFYMLRGIKQLFKSNNNFYVVYSICFILTIMAAFAFYRHSQVFSLVYLCLLSIIFVALAYGYIKAKELEELLEQEDNKPIVHTLEKVDVIHHLAEDYMDLEHRINDIIKHPKYSNSQYSKEQLASILDYKNQQMNILEDYNNI